MIPAVRIHGLTKQYGAKTALESIDLEINPGDFFGLLGPNGAGKSTTIGILTGLTTKTSGTAEVFGYETSDEYKASRRLVGVVPQEFNFDMFQKVEKALKTVASYFGIWGDEAQEKIDELLEEMELSDKRNERINSLSGGMKRRFLIVRALLHSPKILILDEPTAGVDVELRRKIWSFLQKLNQEGTTILLTTHYLEEAETLCSRIAIIDQGKILLNEEKPKLLQRLKTKHYVVRFRESLPADFLEKYSGEAYTPSEDLEVSANGNSYRFYFQGDQDLDLFLKECIERKLGIEDIFSEREKLEDFFVRFLKNTEENL